MFELRGAQITNIGMKRSALIVVLISSISFSLQAQLDDPTRPPGYPLTIPGGKKSLKATSFTLTSVYISASRRAAVINDKNVEIGGYVGGAKVIKILPSSVQLKRKGKTFTVRLLSQVVKKTPAR